MPRNLEIVVERAHFQTTQSVRQFLEVRQLPFDCTIEPIAEWVYSLEQFCCCPGMQLDSEILIADRTNTVKLHSTQRSYAVKAIFFFCNKRTQIRSKTICACWKTHSSFFWPNIPISKEWISSAFRFAIIVECILLSISSWLTVKPQHNIFVSRKIITKEYCLCGLKCQSKVKM